MSRPISAKPKKISSDKMFDIFNYALLTLLIIAVAYPLYYVLIASISDPYEVYGGKTFLLPSSCILLLAEFADIPFGVQARPLPTV